MSIYSQRVTYETQAERDIADQVWSGVINFALDNPGTLPIKWKKAAYDQVGFYDSTVAKAGAESAQSVQEKLASDAQLAELSAQVTVLAGFERTDNV